MKISQISISSPFLKNPGTRILSIIWSRDNYPLNGQSRTSIASLPRFGSSSKKNHISLSTVLTCLVGDVYQKRKKEVCSISAMSLHAEATSIPTKSRRKSYKVGFTGPLCSKTPSSFASHVQTVKTGKILRRYMIPLNPILEFENFDVWDIDFMGPFSNSFGNQFILIA